ncbi:divergent polysaccharide deacetylase family protein, partial [Mesorhizobium sp. M2D.F.Ca.ET.223.01.1.1]
MAHIGKDIERPLGQSLQPKRPASRGIGSGSLVAVLAVLGVIGVSGAIALREKPFRKPQEVAVSTPKVTSAPAAAAA